LVFAFSAAHQQQLMNYFHRYRNFSVFISSMLHERFSLTSSQSNNNDYSKFCSTSWRKTFPFRTMKMRLRNLLTQKSWKEPRKLVAFRPVKRTHKFASHSDFFPFSLRLTKLCLTFWFTFCARNTKYWKLCSSKHEKYFTIQTSIDFSSRKIKEKH
jgi:hypothetical protein